MKSKTTEAACSPVTPPSGSERLCHFIAGTALARNTGFFHFHPLHAGSFSS